MQLPSPVATIQPAAPLRWANSRAERVAAFFFFQAEDGIRDGHVTGVQTCALPILPLIRLASLGTFSPFHGEKERSLSLPNFPQHLLRMLAQHWRGTVGGHADAVDGDRRAHARDRAAL